jgi:molybdopterin-guanine dinucleotide biosynthesis protein A
MDKLLGVVLCGGESLRMGRDKGSLLKEGIPWAQFIADKLLPFQLPIVFSIHPKQRDLYSGSIPDGQFVQDALNALSVKGPLQGLLSVHAQFPSRDLLLLACDMLDLDEPTIRKIIDMYLLDGMREEQHGKQRDGSNDEPPGEHDFFVYQETSFIQPFCGIYTSRGLDPLYTLALEGSLRDFSLQSLLKKGRTRRLPIDRIEAFGNYNSL